MRLPITLSLYIGRYYLRSVLVAIGVMVAIMGLAEMLEFLRKTATKEQVTFGIVLEMTLLRLPATCEKALPFAVLIGSMVALVRLTRSHELIVARAAGISVWQFLAPALMLVVGMGIFFVTVMNPISAAMLSRFELVEARYISGQPSLLAVSATGLWLRQKENEGEVAEHIIHAARMTQVDRKLHDVVIFAFAPDNRFIRRIDAQSAVMREGKWHLSDAHIFTPGLPLERVQDFTLLTDLNISKIQDSFASPRTMSFWQLPSFIDMLENAGFSALRHRIYYNELLASPFMLCAMVLLAAMFSLRLPRRGGTAMMAVAGVFTGFLLYFMITFIRAFGTSGELPVTLAAWAPASIALMVGFGMLLHLEDG